MFMSDIKKSMKALKGIGQSGASLPFLDRLVISALLHKCCMHVMGAPEEGCGRLECLVPF